MAVIKTVRFFFPKKEIKKPVVVQNPYIAHERVKMQNNKWYDDYIAWMHRNNIDNVPVDKLEFMDDHQINKKLKGPI